MLLDKSHRTGTRLLKMRFALIAVVLAALAGAAARTPGLIAFAAPTTPMPIARPPLPPSVPETPAALRPAPRLLAQAAAPPAARPPDSTPSAQFVIDQVQVTDREGRDIADLAQRDFQVFEDNAMQPISVFQRIRIDPFPILPHQRRNQQQKRGTGLVKIGNEGIRDSCPVSGRYQQLGPGHQPIRPLVP